MNCPDCGLPPEATGQNADTGAMVFQCAGGHTWTGGDVAPDTPAATRPKRPRRKTVSNPAVNDEQETST